MAFSFDKTPEDCLVVCWDCGGSWRAGPFPNVGAAQAAAKHHANTLHSGNRKLNDQVAKAQRRAARNG